LIERVAHAGCLADDLNRSVRLEQAPDAAADDLVMVDEKGPDQEMSTRVSKRTRAPPPASVSSRLPATHGRRRR